MMRFVSVVCALVLITGPVMAAGLTPDLNGRGGAHEAQLRDGDFNGDGVIDDLYLVSEDSGRIAVRVRLSEDQDLRLTSVEAAANAPLNLQVVPAGTFQADCGDYADVCAGSIVTAGDGLILTLGSGVSVLVHWRDGVFEQDFVRSDEAMMARALAGLLALNP